MPLVGRRDELARLRAALERAEGGRPRGVLLAGDAGVGKTRLISELTAQAEAGGALVLSGRCIDIASDGLPYLPFADALTPLATSPDPVISGVVFSRPGLGRLLPQLAPVSRSQQDAPDTVDSEMRRDAGGNQDLGQLQLFEAVLGAFTELGMLRPVVLVVEDFHWADGSTRDLLSFLLARLREQRLLLVASYRQEDVHRRHPLRPMLGELARLPEVERLDLAPFDDADARRFVDALAEEPLSADTASDIVKRAEGNAFFVEELLASCIECDGIPAGLADVLLSRLERLAPATQRIIRIVSVADRSVSHMVLTEVTDVGDTELDEALREAVQHHVLVVDGVFYSFRHALLREAVYSDLLPGERSRIHAAYAARLRGKAGPRQATLLAYHSLESNDLPTALVASLQAADEAERRGAPGAALRSVEQALRIWDAVPSGQRPEDVDELRLLDTAASLASRSGEVDRAISYARSMADLLESGRIDVSTRRAARVWLRLAQALQNTDGTRHEAPAIIERAWQLIADDAPSETKAWVQARRATIRRTAGQRQEALRSAGRAIADAQAVAAGDAEADALVTLAALYEADGDSEGARGRLREARSSAERVGALGVELRARHYLGISYQDQGELREAREGADRAVETGLTWSDYGLELRVQRLAVLYLLGEWQVVVREVGTRDMPRELGELPKGAFAVHPASEGRRQHSGLPTIAAARTRAIAVHIAVARGRFAEAADLVEYLRENWGVDAQVALEAGSAGAELANWLGEYGTALRRVREGIAWLEQFQPSLLAGIRIATLGIAAAADQARTARLARNIDAEAAAIAAGEELLGHVETCRKNGRRRAGTLGPESRAWLARAAAEVARLRGTASVALWAEAVEAFGFGAVYEQALCRWRYAEALLADAGSQGTAQDKATEELADAYRVAQQLGAEPLAGALRGLARRGRISLGDEFAARTTTDPLTARERAVLEQVALGHTNRQVGETLYISEKTVSVHLSRVMAKLGASRRTEAVAIAIDRNLLEAPLDT